MSSTREKKPDVYLAPDLSMPPKERIEALISSLIADDDYDGWDKRYLSEVCELISASAETGTTVYEVTIAPFLCNKRGDLHGGAASTILDNLTSTALLTIAKPGFLDGGQVTRTLTVTFLRPIPQGTKVRVECRVVSAGRRLANVYGVIKTMDGKECVTCVHDKALVPRQSKL